ncbi:MAG: beta-lactamase family protein [Bacteroidales bacterium]|nr:beta-lactamase family protein [Bacteroidales bacterium]
MKRLTRYKYIIFTAVIAIVAVMAVNLYSSGRGDTAEEEIAEEEVPPTPLNHLMENSMSDLEETEKFDAAIRRFMRYWDIKGASFALMKNDSLIYAKGYGYSDIKDSIECEVKNVFRVASVSKLITAVAIMRLCETGKLTTQDFVFGEEGILCDSLFLNYRDKNIKKITVEHLLRHTGGFANPHGDAAFNTDLVAKYLGKELPLSMDDMVQYATRIRLRARPGGWFNYSNLGYIILSKVVEKASGMPYETYVKDSVLAPMGCYDMHLANNFSDEFLENEVKYYEVREAEPVPAYDGSDTLVMKSRGGNDVHGLYGAGGWVASPVELLRFVSAIDNCPVKEEFLSQESIDFMTMYSKNFKPAGWATVTSREWMRTGSMAGTSALIKAQKDGYTWVFISNSSSWTGPALSRRMGRDITRALQRVKKWPEVDYFNLAPATTFRENS